MDERALQLEQDMINYNRVKDVVISKLVTEGYLSEEEAEEFCDRCQVLVYKGNWFSKWFDKNQKSDKNGYYIRMIELKDKQTTIDNLIK
jgi:hypothetical protein